MSETVMASKTIQEPKTIFLKDYLAPSYFIDDIHLTFDLHEDYALVQSVMRVRFNRHGTNLSKELCLNGEELILESIKIDGNTVNPSQYEVNDQFLTLYHPPEVFELEIITKLYPQKNTALSGLYRSSKTYCTQCEAEGFRRITYFMDRPDVLSRYTTTISADKSQYPILLSNGNPVGFGDLPSGRHWVKWEDPFKKPCYLFALVAGDFDLIEDRFVTQSGNDVILRVYVEKGYGDQGHHAVYALKEAMRWDELAYGREYDLDIFMIVAIGDFNMGAMENKGLNIFNTKYVLAKPETATDDDYIHILSVVAHEYFHNWTGNRVTCRDWFQLSLKEGLTIFRDHSFSEDTLSRAVMRIRNVTALREVQFAEDAGPLAHPVRPDAYIEINNFYTTTIYEKGSEVLRMLQTILGKSIFRKGMDLYFARHDGEAVTIEDFVRTMESVSGVDLTQFRRWYSQAGTPVVTVEANYDAQQKVYTLKMRQLTPPTPGQPNKLPLHIPILMSLLDDKGQPLSLCLGEEEPSTEKVLQLTETLQTFHFKNINAKPIPSLLRNFSAPVKLNYPYTDNELLFLFKHDTDAFNRWEAGQKYALRVMLNMVKDYQEHKSLQAPSELISMFEYTLQQDVDDKLLQAELLVLPSEKYIGEQMSVVDVTAIHAVREFVLQAIAEKLQKLFLETYRRYAVKATDIEFNMKEVGKRQLKNRCLNYLLLLPAHAEIGEKQFQASLTTNMTDTLAALVGLANLQSPLRQSSLDQFYETWKHDPLVVDKWFSIQATSKLPDTLQNVKALTRHPAFDIKNPNKVYALMGGFGFRNPVHFHAKNGEGYEFLRSFVQELDKLNPQVAGRMVNPLTTWRRYDKECQELMRKQLEVLLQDQQLSTDLYELVTKSLEQ